MPNKYPQADKFKDVCTESNCTNKPEFIVDEAHWCSLHWNMWWYRGYGKKALIEEIIALKDQADSYKSKYLKLKNKLK